MSEAAKALCFRQEKLYKLCACEVQERAERVEGEEGEVEEGAGEKKKQEKDLLSSSPRTDRKESAVSRDVHPKKQRIHLSLYSTLLSSLLRLLVSRSLLDPHTTALFSQLCSPAPPVL